MLSHALKPVAGSSPNPQSDMGSQLLEDETPVTQPEQTLILPFGQPGSTTVSQTSVQDDEGITNANVRDILDIAATAKAQGNSTSPLAVSSEAVVQPKLANAAAIDIEETGMIGSVDITTNTTTNVVETENLLTNPWISKRTPLWNEAIHNWMKTKEGKSQCEELERLMADASVQSVEQPGFLSQLRPEAESSGKWLLRLKRCEPIINATRGIAVTLANTDPHKVAPLVVHGVFACINIFFNRMSPENTDRVLDILFGCSDVIRECVCFELYFTQKSHPAIRDNMIAVQKDPPKLYLKALLLMYEVQRSCKNIERGHSNSREKWLDWTKTTGMCMFM